MKELSLNILDIAENSVKAGATLTQILIEETAETLTLSIIDDGCGMDEAALRAVTDPFYTTRTTRKVGLGIPLLKLACEQTGGRFDITSATAAQSPAAHGTQVRAVFYKNHLDYTPLGDVVATMTTLIQGHPDTDFYFLHTMGEKTAALDTRELRQVLGEVPLGEYEVLKWIEDYLKEQYAA